MENARHETLLRLTLCEENTDEIIAKRLQEEEKKEFLLLQEDSKSLELALKLQAEESKENNADLLTVLDPRDPNPDLHGLFLAFNQQYFWGKLDGVEVRWSNKMTLCAGLCEYRNGGYICIRMSEPLLKFRPRSDMIDTLMHEMIHAFLFVTHNIKDRSGHGPEFHSHMHRINALAGTNVTVYHNFREEVNYYKTHVWKCDGPCQHNPPYYGIVRRSMNRKPQKADSWFENHQATCDKWIDKGRDEKSFVNKKVRLIDFDDTNAPIQISDDETEKSHAQITSASDASSSKMLSTVQCPICGNNSIKADEINEHIDLCIWMTEQSMSVK
ncbi:14703_t:CDS:2 [Funneliformis geosporum]|uniref:Protein with SprT-like domain at the N terminus n=1 Tax=Funneliformis geosporum TaxID=1117311 RepID=A0A9W4SER1_9GLOM|nr:9835_t:CDS:2 [Funneliformis geosporum]CAI2171011.1 14703_t:CDS:2 [Funneliformis geosporum]